jgi:UDP-N-acetylglucosamine 2-epimerase (non-hydrolysing)
MQKLQDGAWKKGGIPPLWDGKTSDRIVAVLDQIYHQQA